MPRISFVPDGTCFGSSHVYPVINGWAIIGNIKFSADHGIDGKILLRDDPAVGPLKLGPWSDESVKMAPQHRYQESLGVGRASSRAGLQTCSSGPSAASPRRKATARKGLRALPRIRATGFARFCLPGESPGSFPVPPHIAKCVRTRQIEAVNIKSRLIGLSVILLVAFAFGLMARMQSGESKKTTATLEQIEAAVQSLDNLDELAR